MNSRGTGIRLYYGMTRGQGGHYQAAGQCLVANNTIVNAKRAGILVGDGRGRVNEEHGIQNVPPEGNRVTNNIVTGTTGDLLLVDHSPGNLVAGNLFFLQGDAIVSSPGDDPVYADPLFRDPESGDFRLGQGSPALESEPVKGASHPASVTGGSNLLKNSIFGLACAGLIITGSSALAQDHGQQVGKPLDLDASHLELVYRTTFQVPPDRL